MSSPTKRKWPVMPGIQNVRSPKGCAPGSSAYAAELVALNEEAQCDVVIVCKPDNLPEHDAPVANPDRPWEAARPAPLGFDFHELLKARSLRTTCPIQLLRRETGRVPTSV